MSATVKRAGQRVVECLEQLERTFSPDRYKLTFVARYVGSEELDADVIVTADAHDDIVAVLNKHRDTKAEPVRGPSVPPETGLGRGSRTGAARRTRRAEAAS